jgi:pilus assembly protein CpaC
MIGVCRRRKKTNAKFVLNPIRAIILSISFLFFLVSGAYCYDAGSADSYGPPSGEAGGARREIKIYVSNGELVELSAPAAKMFVADPGIADIQVPSPERVFIYGKKPGRTAFFALRPDGSKSDVIDIKVSYNTADLRRFLRIEAGELPVSIEETPQGIILSGVVPTAEVAERVRAVALRLAGDGNPLTNNLRLSGSTQVSIRVRIAEISRTVIKDLGVNWSAVANTGIFSFGLSGSAGNSTIASNNVGKGGANITAIVDALASEGLVSILAEPTLTAVSGEKASFLAGGEFPVPITQGANQGLSVDYRKYGVSLDFIPTVLSDRLISLYVRPEVSDISMDGAVSLNGFQIPGVTTRRTETTVQLGSGQSLVIGGLIQSRFGTEIDKIPAAGDMPVLGALFRSTHFRKNESELVVIVTPFLVRPISNPANVNLPTDTVAPASDLERLIEGKIARARKVSPPPVKLKGGGGFMIK